MRCARFSPTWCETRLLLRANRGSITAEWALALPAVVVVAGVVITGIGVGLDQAALHQVAADAARAASLGLGDGDVLSRIRSAEGHHVAVEIQRDPSTHTVWVEIEGSARSTAGINLFHPSSTMCALLPPDLAQP